MTGSLKGDDFVETDGKTLPKQIDRVHRSRKYKQQPTYSIVEIRCVPACLTVAGFAKGEAPFKMC